MAYAEFFKQEDDTLFIDYPNLHRVDTGTIISVDNDAVKIEITAKHDDYLEAKVKHGGLVLINRVVEFENYIPKLAFFSDIDKKQITWGVENKINVIAVSYIRDAESVQSIKSFLNEIGGGHVKIVAKIETKEAITNIAEIIQYSDGVNINRTKLEILDGETAQDTKNKIITLCNQHGKPCIMTTGIDITVAKSKRPWSIVKEEIEQGADAFLLTKETSVADDPIEYVLDLYDLINNKDIDVVTNYSLQDLTTHQENPITDYIIYNAYRASKEIDIKAIICPTESGYTPARLSALKPEVPIISFTKNDNAFRYLNLLRGVKGYKISSTFEYGNIKQIGKEIIRILFKGTSLDDKILIVHSSLEQNVANMINGIELYKFKDI
ncbi:MAG: hypothetical protein H6765_09760 [Candidatus Peribacteria bacterium]|nr:MAG: hypothetical protein H6765_09760 [Candidatus Peribacteria bacterium]